MRIPHTLENIVFTAGILVLSCIQAEIYVISHIYWFLAAIFDFPATRTSDSLRSTLVVLHEPECTGTAVGIPLLSRIQAMIYITSYLLPVSGHHLYFLTDADVRRYSQFPSCFA